MFRKILWNFALCALVIPIAFVAGITSEPFRLIRDQSHHSSTVRQQVGDVQYVVPYQWRQKYNEIDGAASYRLIVYGNNGNMKIRAKVLKSEGHWRITEYSRDDN